jgi:hypothetical protein
MREISTEVSTMAKRAKVKQAPITNQARQGDVFLRRVDGPVPPGAAEVPRDNGRVVLAYGEVTGHAHAIRDPGVCLLRAEGVAFDLLRVAEGTLARLTHEEHGAITVGPGLYEKRIQREYDWSAEAGEMSRAVAD